MKILVSLVVLLLGPAAALHCNVCVSQVVLLVVVERQYYWFYCRMAREASVPTATHLRRQTAAGGSAGQSSTGELWSPSYTAAPTVKLVIYSPTSVYLDLV